MRLQIILDDSDLIQFSEIVGYHVNNMSIDSNDRYEGASLDVVSVIIEFSKATVPALASAVATYLAIRKPKILKINNIEVSGMSPDELKEYLDIISEHLKS